MLGAEYLFGEPSDGVQWRVYVQSVEGWTRDSVVCIYVVEWTRRDQRQVDGGRGVPPFPERRSYQKLDLGTLLDAVREGILAPLGPVQRRLPVLKAALKRSLEASG